MKDLLTSGFNELQTEMMFSDRIADVPRSFIREILKVAISPDIISFAGGLPNRTLFPVEELKQSAIKVFDTMGRDALQYSNSEGYLPLRQTISNYYLNKHHLKVDTENILITSGSQQGLDLLGKVLINQGDEVVIEEPGYLGAIQALSLFRPVFRPVPLRDDGIDCNILEEIVTGPGPKMMYTVPVFQNPSGITYSPETRKSVVQIMAKKNCYIVEDNPYIDLCFEDKISESFYAYLPERTILLGTFSKTTVPGFRLGWIVAPDKLMNKLIIAKQAADLHTNVFTQMLTWQYLSDFDNDAHIRKIISVYGRQRDAMVEAIKAYFPSDVKYTHPKGGMFLWMELPRNFSSLELFNIAIQKQVAFVPGDPFYTVKRASYPTLRLNFSCSDEETIDEGIRRLGEAVRELGTRI